MWRKSCLSILPPPRTGFSRRQTFDTVLLTDCLRFIMDMDEEIERISDKEYARMMEKYGDGE